MPPDFLPDPPPPLERLRATMMRLAAELDGARLYQAAAYVSMAGDSIVEGGEGGSRVQARDDEAGREVDLDFTLVLRQAQEDRDREVWLIRDGDCHRLGPGEPVCAEMRRFLADVAAGGDGYG